MNPSGRHSSRRSSILKLPKQRHPLQAVSDNSLSNENSPNVKPKRRVSFAEKKHVKEFCNSVEQGTVWDNTYEEHDSSQCKTSNSSNEIHEYTPDYISQKNQITYEQQSYINSVVNKGYCEDLDSIEHHVQLHKPVEVSLKSSNYGILNPMNIDSGDNPHVVVVANNLNPTERKSIIVYEDKENEGPHVKFDQNVISNGNIDVICANTILDRGAAMELTEAISSNLCIPNRLPISSEVNIGLPCTSKDQGMLMEITQVVLPTINVHSNKNINRGQTVHNLPSRKTVNAYLTENCTRGASNMKEICENSLEFTIPITSVFTAPTEMENDLYKENRTLNSPVSQDVQMDLTAPVATFHNRETSFYDSIQKEATLLQKGLLCRKVPNLLIYKEDNPTIVFKDVPMEMTEAINMKCLQNKFNSIDSGVEITSNQIQMRDDDAMEITTAIMSYSNKENNGSSKVGSNIQERDVMQSEDRTTIFENSSMTITAAVSAHHRSLSNIVAPNGTNVISDLISQAAGNTKITMQSPNDVSMEVTSAVCSSILDIQNPALDKENYPLTHCYNDRKQHPIVQELPKGREILQDRIDERNSAILNFLQLESKDLTVQDCLPLKEATLINGSQRIRSNNRFGTQMSTIGDVSMEMTNVAHFPFPMCTQENNVACDARKNCTESNTVFKPLIPGTENFVVNRNQIFPLEGLQDSVSNFPLKTSDIAMKGSNVISDPVSTEDTLSNIKSVVSSEDEVIKNTVASTSQNGKEIEHFQHSLLDDTGKHYVESQESPLKINNTVFDQLEEDLESIKPPSFVYECDDMEGNNISINVSNKNNEDLLQEQCVQSIKSIINSELTTLNTTKDDKCPEWNWQEYNAVRCRRSVFENDASNTSQTLIVHKSLSNSSTCKDHAEEIHIVDALRLPSSCMNNTSINNLTQEYNSSTTPNDSIRAKQESTNKFQMASESICSNQEQTLESSSNLTHENSNDIFASSLLAMDLNQVNSELREEYGKCSEVTNVLEASMKESVKKNDDIPFKNVEPVESTHDYANADNEDMSSKQDRFCTLSNKLENIAKSDHIIWDVHEVDAAKRTLVFGFISRSLLVSVFLEDKLDVPQFQISQLKINSRLRTDADILMRIAHRLIIDRVDVEALIRSYKERNDLLQMLDVITSDVKLALDFIIDLKRLSQLNMITLTDERLSFTLLTKQVTIILKVTINIKTFSSLGPADINVECLLGTIREEDIKYLIKNVKRDHKFLRRYINDVRDYIYLMEDSNMNPKI